MQNFQIDFDSQEDKPYHDNFNSHTYDVSILKHIPRPLSILNKKQYQFITPKCLYESSLNKANENLYSSETAKYNNNTKLISMEETEHQHHKMKDKINRIFKNSGKTQNRATFWQMYSSLVPYYVRFPNPLRKNLGNVFIGVNGVKISQNKKSFKVDLPKLTNPIQQPHSRKLYFDSHFESGNLLYVYKNNSSQAFEQYDLILQNDINTRGHNQWFYFKIQNYQKNRRIKLNIINLIKQNSLFHYGQKILIFSQRRFKKTGKGWMREGQKIQYEQNNIFRQNKDKSYYTLSFQYTFKEQNDVIYVCPSYPYTYTQLITYLEKLLKISQYNHCLTIKSVGETVGGNIVNLISISTGKNDIADKNTNIVWILARQHPSQTTSSYMIQGIIDYLLTIMGNLQNNTNQSSTAWLDNYTFKIVPMVNVDGVIHGNTRSQLTGVDPNRMWNKPYRRLVPIINTLKKLILETKNNISMILDLHSHSKKLGCFFYGNSILYNPKLAKIYPTFVCQKDQRFDIKNCRFRGGYQSTLRRVLFSEVESPNIFTVQCSHYGYRKNQKIIDYTPKDFRQMGARLIQSYFQLEKAKISKKIQQIIDQNQTIHQLIDVYDSARSDSSLSDQQYQQIYGKRKNIKNQSNNSFLPKKKNIDKSINSITGPQIQSSNKLQQLSTNHTKMRNLLKKAVKNVLDKTKRKKLSIEKTVTMHQYKKFKKSIKGRQNNHTLVKIQHQDKDKKQNDKIKNISNLKSLPKPFIIDDIYQKYTLPKKKIAIKTNQISVQTSFQLKIDRQKSNELISKKKDTYLCIVGSAIEEQRYVFIDKNQVGLQTIPYEEHQNLIKECKSTKIPKMLTYICKNILSGTKENAVYPIQKKQTNSHMKTINNIRNPMMFKN